MSEQVKAHEVAGMFEKCMLISQNSKHDIFFGYSPHVNAIDVRGCLYGWANDNNYKMLKANPCINSSIYLDDIELFNEVNAELELILNEAMSDE